MYFFKPCIDILESILVIEIVDEYNPNSIFIVRPSDGPKRFLSSLYTLSYYTVSQICILTVMPSTTTILVANSTPMVGLLSELKESLINLLSIVLLPTEASPIRMYLKI